MKKNLKFFLGTIYFLFIIFATYLYLHNSFLQNSYVNIIFFVILLFIMRNITMLFNSMTEIVTSINLPVLFPAMVILNPFWVAVISFLGTIELKYRKKHFIWYQFLFNRTMLFMAAGSAALVFSSVKNYFNSSLVIPFLLASITYFIINNTLVFLVVKIAADKQDTSLAYFIQLSKNLVVSYFLGLILYYSYVNFGKFMLVMLIFLIYIVKDFIFSKIRQLNSYTQIIESFLKVIDSKDHYTEGHCQRVAHYTNVLCDGLGVKKVKSERIVNMAKIHDIGKINVDDKILKSSARLTNEEYEEVKNHCIYGYDILKDINLMNKDLEIILYHHERYDGFGYPEGKKGEDIPLGARILSVCDAFDVMTTGRIYKPAMSREEVVQELNNCAGTQFDPVIVKKMFELIKKGKFDNSFKSKDSKKNINQEVDTSMPLNMRISMKEG